MRLIRPNRVMRLLALIAIVAAACAEPDLGPPSSTTLPVATPTPTPEPEPDPALGPSNTTTTTTLAPIDIVPTATPTPEPEPEVGLTDDLLRIGVIADVSTGTLADDRGESAWNAVLAWARSVNDRGGLAGRQVVVQPIDSAVFFNKEALEEACAEVFAIVGSWSVNDGDDLDVLLSPECSMPDFPAEARTPRRRQSPLTFQSNPQTVDLEQAGPAQYLAAQFPDDVDAAALPVLDLRSIRVASERLIEAYTASGFQFEQRPTVGLDADLAELAVTLADSETTALVWNADAERLTTLLAELDALGGRPPVVNCGEACYGTEFLDGAGSSAEGVTASLSTVPLEEADASFELTQYRFWLGRVRPEEVPDAVGVKAWAAALLFEEAVNRATLAGTGSFSPDFLSRSAVLDAAEMITEWDANGLHGVANPAEGVGSPCFVLLVVANGEWQREQPFGRGRFDCEADNLVRLVDTVELGLGDPDVEIGTRTVEPLTPPTPVPEPEG